LELSAKVVFGPNDGVELAAELRLKCLDLREQRRQLGAADDEHIDVATDIVVAASVGAKDEGEPDAAALFEDLPNLRHEPDRAGVKLAQRQIQRISRIHPPHSQRPHTLALDQTLPQELLEGEVDRTWRSVDPANEFAGVEFLSRCAGQKGKEPGLGCRASDVGHSRHSNTRVFIWNTSVSLSRR